MRVLWKFVSITLYYNAQLLLLKVETIDDDPESWLLLFTYYIADVISERFVSCEITRDGSVVSDLK